MRYLSDLTDVTISVFGLQGANYPDKMIKRFLFLTLFSVSVFPAFSQTVIQWDDLLDVRYTTSFDGDAGYVYMKPTYGESLLALEGKVVEIRGYVLPMDTEGNAYALSAFPYSSCFFCGGGSRESIMDLKLASLDKRYSTDDVVTFRGVFTLSDDQFGLNYVLEEAVEVE